MCHKLQIELNELHSIIVSNDFKAIADKIEELYQNYERYSKSSKKIIDKYVSLGLLILSKV